MLSDLPNIARLVRSRAKFKLRHFGSEICALISITEDLFESILNPKMWLPNSTNRNVGCPVKFILFRAYLYSKLVFFLSENSNLTKHPVLLSGQPTQEAG